MKKLSRSLYWLSANICACLGVVSVFSAYLAIIDSETLFELTKPLAIASSLLVFPFFMAFVFLGFVSSINEVGTTKNKPKKIGGFIEKSLNDFVEPIKILLNIHKAHLVSSLFLLMSGAYIYKTNQIGGVNWAFGSPFEREHAISFGATAAIFYAIMLPFYSHRSTKDTFFDNES